MFHQGAQQLGEAGLRTGEGLAALRAIAAAQLWQAGQLQVATALDMLQVLDSHLDTVRRRLLDAAAHLTGAKVLAARLYGVGPITALALTCCLGGGGRFSSARKAVRFAGLDVTVYSSAGQRSPSISDPVRGQPPGTAEAYPVACWPDDMIVEFPGWRSGLAVHLR